MILPQLKDVARAYKEGDQSAKDPLHDLLCEAGFPLFAYAHLLGDSACGPGCIYLSLIIEGDESSLKIMEKAHQYTCLS